MDSFVGISGPDLGRVIAAACWFSLSIAVLGAAIHSRDWMAVFGAGAFFLQCCLFVGGLAGRGVILEELRWEAVAAQPYLVYAMDLCLLGCVLLIFFRVIFKRN